MSLYKDGRGFLRYRVHDSNGRVKMLSANIRDWEAGETHPVAVAWKIGTVEQRDELHLFVDGREVPNTYRFYGYLPVPSSGGVRYMDTAGETLVPDAYQATMGGNDMITVAGSDTVYSAQSVFTEGIAPGDQFTILDSTTDGTNTRTPPYVFVAEVVDDNRLRLEIGPPGSGIPYPMVSSLAGVKYSVNQLTLATVADPLIEKVRLYAVSPDGDEVELRSPDALYPDHSFDRDGYQDYVVLNNGLPIGWALVLYSYGLTQQRSKQLVYVWPYRRTNLLKTIMPQPTAVSKIRVTNIITRRTNIEAGAFALVATVVGGHPIQTLASNLSFCQPSEATHGRRLAVTIMGDNFDFGGFNLVVITPQAFLKEFSSWPRDFFQGARETVHDLRTTYRVGSLSNSNPLHWERFRELEEDFVITLFSHLLGTVKPDPEIFMLALSRCDVEASKVYFFDDCSANVHTAQSLGISAFHVDSFKAPQDVLRIQGLLSDSSASEVDAIQIAQKLGRHEDK